MPYPLVGDLSCPTGEVIDEEQFPATAAGLQRAIAWVGRRTEGDLDTLGVVEGVGTYGARLARAAAGAGYLVSEAARMNARANRAVGKSDPLDARRIAQAVLALEVTQLRRPRAEDGVGTTVRVPSPSGSTPAGRSPAATSPRSPPGVLVRRRSRQSCHPNVR